MKIAIYIDNRKIDSVDCSDLLKGNPGIGGTEYCVLFLAQMIKEYYPDTQVSLFVEKSAKLPKVDEIVTVNGLAELAQKVKKNDILVISSRRDGQPLSQNFFKQLEKENIKTVIWGHNYYYSDYCEQIANCSAIKANVFVGKQQYDRYVDHSIIEKSTYIYNMYPLVEKKQRTGRPAHNVTYIGSLVPEKGFQVLASAWKNILKKVPDAQLNVIGSGKLYARDFKLGRYGIAEEKFENEFMTHLTDVNGRILPSVHFCGVMGAEKDEVILKTGVGVVNPTGRTETFGISALDFESMGVPVVTIGKGGFLDTVINNKTGILTQNIADAIVELLVDEKKNIKYGEQGVKLATNFSPEIIVKEWMELFNMIILNKTIPYHSPDDFMHVNLKWLRVFNYKLKKTFNIKNGISVIEIETFARNILRRMGR